MKVCRRWSCPVHGKSRAARALQRVRAALPEQLQIGWAEELGRRARAEKWEKNRAVLEEIFGPGQKNRTYL